MTKKSKIPSPEQEEFSRDEVLAAINEIDQERGGHDWDELEQRAKSLLRGRRRLDDLCERADIPYRNREAFKSAIALLLYKADMRASRRIEQEFVSAEMQDAFAKVSEAKEAVAGLSKNQRYALGKTFKRSCPRWLLNAMFDDDFAKDVVNWSEPDEVSITANRVPELLSVVVDVFAAAMDRNPNCKIAVEGYAFREFITELLTYTNKSGGWLPFSRPKGAAVIKGALPDALDLLKPALPDGFFPDPLPVGILEKIQASITIKPVPRSRARVGRQAPQTPNPTKESR